MRQSHLLVLLASTTLVACSPEMSLRARAEAEQEVRARFDTWVRAMNNMDMDSLLLMHHAVPELTVIRADGRVAHGWEEEEALHQEAMEGVDRINFGVQNVEVQVLTRRIALVTFRHSTDVILEDGERGEPYAGHVSMVWLRDREDDQWKIHMEHHSVRRTPTGG
ncbi:MAG: nuclear transport factor 2 family protein [Gemmatimonadota bacterium]|nr:MAG: nuclear transport factor 2 family protein [Gemmatimonadota bacterium]